MFWSPLWMSKITHLVTPPSRLFKKRTSESLQRITVTLRTSTWNSCENLGIPLFYMIIPMNFMGILRYLWDSKLMHCSSCSPMFLKDSVKKPAFLEQWWGPSLPPPQKCAQKCAQTPLPNEAENVPLPLPEPLHPCLTLLLLRKPNSIRLNQSHIRHIDDWKDTWHDINQHRGVITGIPSTKYWSLTLFRVASGRRLKREARHEMKRDFAKRVCCFFFFGGGGLGGGSKHTMRYQTRIVCQFMLHGILDFIRMLGW